MTKSTTGFVREYLPLISDYQRALKSTTRFTRKYSPLVRYYSRALLTCVKYVYMRCNTRVFENNPQVIFEMRQGTPEDMSVFVNLVVSCTVCISYFGFSSQLELLIINTIHLIVVD